MTHVFPFFLIDALVKEENSMNYSYTLLQTIAFQQRCSFGQFQRSQLFVQSLPAKLIKFDFSGEIAPHHVFHFFADRWFEEIPVDSGKRIHLV